MPDRAAAGKTACSPQVLAPGGDACRVAHSPRRRASTPFVLCRKTGSHFSGTCARLDARRCATMQVFNLQKEQAWNPKKHVEKILGEVEEGDVTVACWEPGQISPY